MSSLNLNDLLLRAAAIPVEAVGGEGKPYWIHSQEAFPFFVAQLRNFSWDLEESEELDQYEFDLVVRHVTGNRTGGIPGEAEAKLYTQMPQVMAAFLSRDLLQSAAYPTPPDWLESTELQPPAGLTIFDASGIGGVGLQIGTDYVIRCVARLDNIQTYE